MTLQTTIDSLAAREIASIESQVAHLPGAADAAEWLHQALAAAMADGIALGAAEASGDPAVLRQVAAQIMLAGPCAGRC